MKAKMLNAGFPKTYAVVFDEGDEAMSRLLEWAEDNDVAACQVTGIGAVSEAVLGYFDWQRSEYHKNTVRVQTEVCSLTGDITCGPDGHQLHLHVVLADSDARAYGGHLLEAHVRPTLELIVMESPVYLARSVDPKTSLALIKL
jgi:predicted DNA-binding protein with PD1-like motif